jgi:peptidoglycan/LPS O-acetylase OafA/YrhL
MTSVPEREANRLDGVDLLRTLAILFVLMNHVNVRLSISKVPFKQGLPNNLVHALFYNGQNGVRIFFAISGFLITSMSLRRWGALGAMDWQRFYRLRFARIAPLLLALLAALSLLHASQVQDYLISAKRGGFFPALFAALTFHINLQEATHGYLPGSWDILWSLSVEEVFYIGFPLACLILRRKSLLIALLACFVATGPFARTVLAHGNELWSDYSYLSGMDAIAMGCLTALFLDSRQLSRRVQWTSAITGAALMILILCFPVRAIGRAGLDMTILAIGTCLVIVPAAQSNWRGPHLLLIPGRRSYEVYMTHMFVVFGFLHLFLFAGKPMWGVPLYFLAVILVATLLGSLIARFFSDPMNQRLRGGSGSTS